VSKLFGLIQAILPEIEPQQARDQAYLAQSVDIYDLERRMREIEPARPLLGERPDLLARPALKRA
jgi:hypothetical protein